MDNSRELSDYHDSKWHRDEFYSNGLDDIGQSSEEYYSSEEKALVRKIDWMLMPIICALDFLQFLDKSTISYAALMGFREDLNLVGDQFSLLGSIFYLGYLVFQLPNNYMLQRIPIGRYIGIIVVLWGIVLLCSAWGRNFGQLAGLRFLLGFFEAGIYPSLTLLVSTFYRRSEQIARLGAFWICNGIALMIGGVVSYGIGHMKNVGGLKPWQWVMILLGGVTILVGVIAFFFLIDSPKARALQLNAEQEMLVEERTRDNATVRTTEIKSEQIWEALKEVRFWCFCFACLFINLQNGAMTTYNAQIASSFGFDQLQSLLLSTGTGVFTILFIAVGIVLVKKYHQTIYTACFIMCFDVLGLILLLVIPVPKAKIIGFFLSWSYVGVYVLLITCVSNNVTGYTKKIFYNGVLMIFYTIGNFVGPLMMVEPPYIGGVIGYLIADAIVIVLLLVARWRMSLINRRRLLVLNNSTNTMAAVAHNYDLDDISDVQDQTFIYLL
ncbi:major facilitator superfamily domain-containing protein [Choanephora cucurbitarum]|nr:major facilitator superfamily domain-containing protein [Choanephora cucurbitarum]